jgi:cytochrome oxidase Cu insertion factor (SCO1/SenC/PrrC family)
MMRIRLGMTVCTLLLASACAGERADGVAAIEPASASPSITEATMHPLTGQVVGARDGHGEHSYDVPPMESLGGSFQLVEATKAQAFTDQDLKGSWALVYFGYMECLEACPIALKSMPAAVDQLNAAGIATKAVFVDINAPRLDDMTGNMGHGGQHGGAKLASASGHGGHGGQALTGPEIRRQAIAKWGPAIDPDVIFLSGTRKELAVAVKAFQSRIEAAMLKNDEPIHHINHTTNIYILDPTGQVTGVVYHSDSVKVMSDTVKAMAKTAPAVASEVVAAVKPAPKGHSGHE